MKEQNIVRRLVPVDFLDLDGIELWLEEMAAKGLHFQKFGTFFAQFRPGDPAKVRWHAEPTERAGPPSPPRPASMRIWAGLTWERSAI